MQYLLSNITNRGIRELADRLKEDGFTILHSLDTTKDDEMVAGICVDLDERCAYPVGPMVMALVFHDGNHPLYCEEVLDHYDRLITARNVDLYHQLLQQAKDDENRPEGAVYRF